MQHAVHLRPPEAIPRLSSSLSSSLVSLALVSSLLAAALPSLSAQNTNMAGLQGDPSIITPGGWIGPAAPLGNPQPNPPTAYLNNRIQLGKALFWDEQVSTSNTMACGTCHMPQVGGVDPRPAGVTTDAFGHPILGSLGVVPQAIGLMTGTIDYGFNAPPSTRETRLVTPIHVPTMIGAYMFGNQFWDMRAGPTFNWGPAGAGPVLFANWASLENQAVGPPTSDVEMGHQNLGWGAGIIQAKLDQEAPLALATGIPPSIPPAWLGMTYQAVFDAVFAASAIPGIAAPSGVTRERFAMAIAAYTRTLIPDQAPIDTGTMTPQEINGFNIFVFSGCGQCHSVSGNPMLIQPGGVLANPWDNVFSDGIPHDIFLTNPARSIGPVKTPTLRNVGLRTRFFHDGRGRVVGGVPRNTIPDIVDFYDIDQDPANGGPGGNFELKSPLGPMTLNPIERADVIAFLSNALTDPRVAAAAPPFDRPTLYSESVPFGSTVVGPATSPWPWQPLMIDNSPPLMEKVGGPGWWKIGVGSNGAGAGGPVIPAGTSVTLYADLALGGSPPGFWLSPAATLVGTVNITPEGFGTVQQPIALVPAMLGVPSYLQWATGPIGAAGTAYSEAVIFTPF